MIYLLTSICFVAAREPISAKLGNVNGWPVVLINDQPEFPMQYSPTGNIAQEPWLPRTQELYKDFASQGYRLFGVEIWLSRIWNENGVDAAFVRRQLAAVRNACEDAAIDLRIYMETRQ